MLMLLILKYLTIYKHYVNILSLLKLHRLISESVMLFKHLIPGCLLLLLQSQSIFPSNRLFSHESVLCIIWPKYCCFSFSIKPSNECSGLISFRIDWFGLLAVQETLKSLLQQHSTKASILQCFWVSLCGSAGKESACNAWDLGSVSGLGRSPREGKGYPLQYSGLENSMNSIVHGVAKSQTGILLKYDPQSPALFLLKSYLIFPSSKI